MSLTIEGHHLSGHSARHRVARVVALCRGFETMGWLNWRDRTVRSAQEEFTC